MHRLLVVFFLAAGIGITASPAAKAQVYAGIHGGANFLQDSDIEGSGADATASFDPGFAVGGVLGYRFGVLDNLALDVEGEFTYRLNGIDEISDGGGSASGDGDAQSFAWMANAWLAWQIGDSGFSPYIGGGFGGVHIDIKDTEVAGIALGNESDFVVGGQVGSGVEYQFDEHFAVSLDYRFLITEKASFNSLDAEYQSHSVLLGVKYLF